MKMEHGAGIFAAIRVYRHMGDPGMVMSLNKIKDIEDRNLISGYIAMFMEDFTLAQELFLDSSYRLAALEVSQANRFIFFSENFCYPLFSPSFFHPTLHSFLRLLIPSLRLFSVMLPFPFFSFIHSVSPLIISFFLSSCFPLALSLLYPLLLFSVVSPLLPRGGSICFHHAV